MRCTLTCLVAPSLVLAQAPPAPEPVPPPPSALSGADRDALLEALVRARTLEPRDSRLMAEYARAYQAAGLVKEAGDAIALALSMDSSDSETIALVGEFWLAAGRPEQARAVLRALESGKPRFDRGYHHAKDLLLSLGDIPAAGRVLEGLMTKERDELELPFELGLPWLTVDPTQATRWIELGLMRPRVDGDERVEAALAFLKAGLEKPALQQVELRFLKSKREDWITYLDLAFAARAAKFESLATRWAALARDQKPGLAARLEAAERHGDLEVWVHCARLQFLLGETAAAEKSFQQILEARVRLPKAPLEVAQARFQMGQAPEGLKALALYANGPDKEAGDLEEPALLAARKGDLALAEGLMNRYRQRKGTSGWKAYAGLGVACLEAGDLARALEWLRRGALNKEAKEHLGWAAVRLMDLREPKHAKEMFDLALALDPGDWPNCTEFGRAALRQGERELAAEAFQRGSRQNPMSGRMWNEIALAYAERGVGLRNKFRLD